MTFSALNPPVLLFLKGSGWKLPHLLMFSDFSAPLCCSHNKADIIVETEVDKK